MTNLLIFYPDIPANAVRIRSTAIYDEDLNVRNLIGGERYQFGALSMTSSWLETIEFELASATSRPADFLAIARADITQSVISSMHLAGGNASIFSPSDSGTPTGWWVAGKEIFKDGSNNVYQWNDLSGNANHLVSASGARPTYSANGGANGMNAVVFNGSSQYLTSDALASLFTGTDMPYTVIMAFQRTGSSGADALYSWGRATSATPLSYLYIDTQYNVTRRDDGVTQDTESAGTADTNPHVVSVVFTGTAVSVWLDGSNIINAQSLDVGPMTLNRFTLGALRRSTITEYLEGNISEVVLFNSAIGDQERSDIETALKNRWVDTPSLIQSSYNAATLYGPDSNDYYNTFTQSNAYRYWWLSKNCDLTNFKLSKAYFGTAFDMGVEPDYSFERIEPNEANIYFDSGARKLNRVEKPIYRFDFTWTGVTDQVVENFNNQIARHRDQHRFFLATTTQHQVLNDERIVHCELVDFDAQKVGGISDYNIITATFLEVVG